jgi:hypothetical protein
MRDGKTQVTQAKTGPFLSRKARLTVLQAIVFGLFSEVVT